MEIGDQVLSVLMEHRELLRGIGGFLCVAFYIGFTVLVVYSCIYPGGGEQTHEDVDGHPTIFWQRRPPPIGMPRGCRGCRCCRCHEHAGKYHWWLNYQKTHPPGGS